MDDTALAIGGDPAEGAFDPHADLCITWVADNLGGHLGTFIEFDDGEYIRSTGGELVGSSLDDRERYNSPLPGKLVINDLAFPAAVRTEGPWGEEVAATGLALRTYQVVALGDLSSGTSNGHSWLVSARCKCPWYPYFTRFETIRSWRINQEEARYLLLLFPNLCSLFSQIVVYSRAARDWSARTRELF